MAKENVELYRVTGWQTKESFERNAYLTLYTSSKTQEDIDTVVLSDIAEGEVTLVRQSATFNFDYTAEIGYDRQEQYVDVEEYYDSDTKTRRKRNVIKTRTVTDWRPHSGKSTNKQAYASTVLTPPEADIPKEKEWLYKVSDTEKVFGFAGKLGKGEPAGTVTVSDECYWALRGECRRGAEAQVKSEVPGDHYKNFRSEDTLQSEYMTAKELVRRRVEFKTDGGALSGSINQFAVEPQPTVYGLMETTDAVADDLAAAGEAELEAHPAYKQNKMLNGITLFGGIALVILSFIIGDYAAFLLFIPGAISVVISQTIFAKKMKQIREEVANKYRELENNHLDDLQNKKLALLEARFAKMGFAPLTDEEKARFVLSAEEKEKYFQKKAGNLANEKHVKISDFGKKSSQK